MRDLRERAARGGMGLGGGVAMGLGVLMGLGWDEFLGSLGVSDS